jgi:multisubunit Na+/H+ antiporter MnhE subunit
MKIKNNKLLMEIIIFNFSFLVLLHPEPHNFFMYIFISYLVGFFYTKIVYYHYYISVFGFIKYLLILFVHSIYSTFNYFFKLKEYSPGLIVLKSNFKDDESRTLIENFITASPSTLVIFDDHFLIYVYTFFSKKKDYKKLSKEILGLPEKTVKGIYRWLE